MKYWIHLLKKSFKFTSAFVLLGFLFSYTCKPNPSSSYLPSKASNTAAVELSVQLLKEVKENGKTKNIILQLEKYNPDSLALELEHDIQKKAFWINLYNAFIQLKLKENPSLYDSRNSFFSEDRFIVAGENLSFDQVEHGILRKSAFKFGLGYLNKPFTDSFIKANEVETLDNRIHFALNCGAKSCPPIAIYSAEDFNSKIDDVAKTFLSNNSKYRKDEEEISITKLFSWFRGDFGGNDGTLNVLKYYKIIPQSSNAEITFLDYDWTILLDNYYE